MTERELCNKNGWQVGDILEGDAGYGPHRITLTAVGREAILALCEHGERSWTLQHRDWKKVGHDPHVLRAQESEK